MGVCGLVEGNGGMGRYHHLLLLLVIGISVCAAVDTLIQGQKIKDGQTIISADKVFELGFFSPDGSGNNRYLGIWYYGITPLNTIWIANRDRPLDSSSSNNNTNSSSSSTFGIGNDGNLILLSSNQTLFWSTQLPSSANNTVAQLQESGNLVLLSASSNTTLWQSFDYPSDTFLPGMKIQYDRKTRKSTTFTSWRSPIDPSPGNYTVGLDGSIQPQIYMREGSRIRWRSGQWNGATFIGTKMRAQFLYGFKLTTNDADGTFYFSFKPYNESLLRFVTQWDGVENVTILTSTQQWSTVWAQPLQACELYNNCGANALCTDGANTQSICSCLQGYQPSSPEDWAKGNWTAGCSRRTALSCEQGSGNSSTSDGAAAAAAANVGFLKLEAMKLPDRSEWISTTADITACQDICYNNCSCRAYAFFTSGGGCLVWFTDLLDIHCSPDVSGNDFYIKLAASELTANGKSKQRVTTLVVVLVLVVILILVLFFLLWKYRAKVQEWWKAEKKVEASPLELYRAKAKLQSQEPVSSSDLGDISREGNSSELALHKFDSIAAATDNFSPANFLGRGGFGDVYKGVLPWGEEIAVKRLSSGSGQGQEEFKNEAILIAKLQHRNLVRLSGCCIERGEKILIYEYMPNKSLDAFLFNQEKKSLLDWKTRFNIIEGIARGLVYLHRDSRLRIVHRDLKVSNILLDADMNPKISDFGMARIFGSDQHQENTTRVVGTYGYMSPEYAMEGVFSVKSDVYSFGVLVLEIISGQKNNNFHRSDSNCLNLVGHAWRLWDEGRATELIDPSISDSPSTRQILRCIHIGLLCVQDRPLDRPVMPSVVIMLASEATITVMPKQPTFNLFGRSPNGTEESSMPDQEIFTSSDVTVTSVTSR